MQRRDFLVGVGVGGASTALAGLAGVALGGSRPSREAAAPATGAATGTAAGGRGNGAAAGSRTAPAATAEPAKEPVWEGRRSYSQQGEDLILYNLLHDEMEIDKPTYLDIGAGEPVMANNTYLLYTTGCRGVLVEPNPTLVEKLKAVRPGDVVIQAGVGVTAQAEADYYVIRDRWPYNTFSPEAVAELRRKSDVDPVERVLKMPLIPINQIMAEHFHGAPDFLSIDTEGLDLAILRSMDFRKYRPAAICAESRKPAVPIDSTPIARLLRAWGYVPAAASLWNTLFALKRRLRRR